MYLRWSLFYFWFWSSSFADYIIDTVFSMLGRIHLFHALPFFIFRFFLVFLFNSKTCNFFHLIWKCRFFSMRSVKLNLFWHRFQRFFFQWCLNNGPRLNGNKVAHHCYCHSLVHPSAKKTFGMNAFHVCSKAIQHVLEKSAWRSSSFSSFFAFPISFAIVFFVWRPSIE